MKSRKMDTPAWSAWVIVGLIWFVPGAGAWAQDIVPQPSTELRESFSDDELQSFVKANEKVMTIQLEAEEKMINAIEGEGLTLDRFNVILEQQRDPQRGVETSPEELKSFNNAAEAILQENERVEKQMTTSIEAEGIDIETYKLIMLAYQQNPAVKGRVNKMVNGEN